MKYLLTLVFISIVLFNNAPAQTFTTEYGDTAFATGWNNIYCYNDITNTTTSAFAITWHVIGNDLPASWTDFGIGDNYAVYANISGALTSGTSHTSDNYIPGTSGSFETIFLLTSAVLGTHYVKVELTGDSYTKDIVFVITKKLQADSIYSTAGNVVCDSSTLYLHHPSVGSDITYKWQYAPDSLSWNDVGSSNSYHINSLSGVAYYRCIIGATGYTEKDTTPVYKIVLPPSPTVTIAVTPDTNIVAGTVVNFIATPHPVSTSALYQWRKNGNNIPAATANVYVTNSLSNGDTIDCIYHSVTNCGTPDSAKSNKIVMHVTSAVSCVSSSKQLVVYPNPCHGSFEIDGTDISKVKVLELSNVLGEIVWRSVSPQQKVFTLPDNILSGLYFLNIIREDDKQVSQIYLCR